MKRGRRGDARSCAAYRSGMSRMAVVRGRCVIAGFVGFVGQVASCIFDAREVDVMGAWVRVGSQFASTDGRDFPALRRSIWVVWRAFGAVS